MDSAGNVTVLYSFTGQSDGSWPESEVVQGADGNLYGTTAYGGMYDDGVLFRISNLGVLKTSMNALEYREPSTPHILPPLIRNPHVGLPAPSSPNQK
jgi:uncharacterized repeat protein (TIGR03803 family)